MEFDYTELMEWIKENVKPDGELCNTDCPLWYDNHLRYYCILDQEEVEEGGSRGKMCKRLIKEVK